MVNAIKIQPITNTAIIILGRRYLCRGTTEDNIIRKYPEASK